LSAHPGITATYELIKRSGNEIKITKKEVKRYIDSCERCRTAKPSRKSPMGYLRPIEIPGSPNRILCLDLVSGLNTRGTQYIVVCTDKFSKYVTYIPFKKTPTSKTISAELNEKIFSRFGYPEVIITHRGPQFKGKGWRKEMGQWGIATRTSTTAHPQSDGQSERSIQTLLHNIRTTWQHDKPIKELLPSLEFAANNTRRESTGTSPFQIIYNYQIRRPFDEEVKLYRPANIEEIKEKLERSKERMKETVDKRRSRPDEYEVGDEVYVHEKGLRQKSKINELDQLYRGPFRIVSRNENDTYKVALPRELGRVHSTFHVSKLRSSKKREQEDQEKREKESRSGSSGNNITIENNSKNK
jgi:Integrase core domain